MSSHVVHSVARCRPASDEQSSHAHGSRRTHATCRRAPHSLFTQYKSSQMISLRNLVLFLVAFADVTPSQHLPEKEDDTFNFHIPSDVLFHDTKVIPESKEVTIYLPRNETKRFFFVVEHAKLPIFFALTPCSSALQWKIFFRYQKFQHEGKTSDDPMSQQRDLMRRPKKSKRLLQSFVSDEMMSFLSREFRSGLFILEITARENDAIARLFATSSPDTEMTYPELASTQVEIVQKNEEGVTIAWKGSLSELKWGTPIEYCVVYNTRKYFRSMCAVESDRKGELILPPMPKYAGFGFQWEKKSAKMPSQRKRKPTPLPPSEDKSVSVNCVGRRTWLSLTDLLPGTPYFVNVFAVNPATNRSTAYKAMSFVSDGQGNPIVLPERQIVHLSLRHRQGVEATFNYTAGVKCGQVILAVLPCFGFLTVQVRRDSHLIATSKIEHLTRFRVSNVSASESIYIKVTGDGKQTQSLKIVATRRSKKDPFPEMRDDAKLIALHQSITCHSTTIKWSAPDEKALYCLYKRKENASTKRLFTKQNWCSNGDVAKRSEKIFCRRYRRNSKQRMRHFVTENLSGLDAATRYVLELQVSRRKGETLNYEPVYVTTKDKC